MWWSKITKDPDYLKIVQAIIRLTHSLGLTVVAEGVETKEYEIIQDNLTLDIDRNLQYEGGLHWVGLFYSLVNFPSIHKSI